MESKTRPAVTEEPHVNSRRPLALALPAVGGAIVGAIIGAAAGFAIALAVAKLGDPSGGIIVIFTVPLGAIAGAVNGGSLAWRKACQGSRVESRPTDALAAFVVPARMEKTQPEVPAEVQLLQRQIQQLQATKYLDQGLIDKLRFVRLSLQWTGLVLLGLQLASTWLMFRRTLFEALGASLFWGVCAGAIFVVGSKLLVDREASIDIDIASKRARLAAITLESPQPEA